LNYINNKIEIKIKKHTHDKDKLETLVANAEVEQLELSSEDDQNEEEDDDNNNDKKKY